MADHAAQPLKLSLADLRENYTRADWTNLPRISIRSRSLKHGLPKRVELASESQMR